MPDHRNVKFIFTWRYYLFGKNILAGCFQMLVGIGFFIVLLATLSWWLGI